MMIGGRAGGGGEWLLVLGRRRRGGGCGGLLSLMTSGIGIVNRQVHGVIRDGIGREGCNNCIFFFVLWWFLGFVMLVI